MCEGILRYHRNPVDDSFDNHNPHNFFPRDVERRENNRKHSRIKTWMLNIDEWVRRNSAPVQLNDIKLESIYSINCAIV